MSSYSTATRHTGISSEMSSAKHIHSPQASYHVSGLQDFFYSVRCRFDERSEFPRSEWHWRVEAPTHQDTHLKKAGVQGGIAKFKLTWLVLGEDPAARSHRVEQFTAL